MVVIQGKFCYTYKHGGFKKQFFRKGIQMNRSKVVLAAVAMIGFLFAVSASAASDANKPTKGKQVTIVGKVQDHKDKSGKLERVKVVTEKDKHYWVVLDAKGEELGKTMAGKEVEVTGTVHMKNDIHWLTVEKYTAVTSPKK
jgi:hypothetical protein